MSTTTRPPLLSDEELQTMSGHGEMTAWEKYIGEAVRDRYEAARAKDAELIQELVDQVEACRVELCSAIPHLPRIGVKLATAREAECRSVLEAAAAAGFKPSEP